MAKESNSVDTVPLAGPINNPLEVSTVAATPPEVRVSETALGLAKKAASTGFARLTVIVVI